MKFTFKLDLVKTSNKGEKKANKPVSFEKLPFLILAKSFKEVNEILKFFKKNNLTSEKKDTKNCMYKYHLHLLIQEKFSRSKKHFYIYRLRKLKIYKKLSMVKTNPSQESI